MNEKDAVDMAGAMFDAVVEKAREYEPPVEDLVKWADLSTDLQKAMTVSLTPVMKSLIQFSQSGYKLLMVEKIDSIKKAP